MTHAQNILMTDGSWAAALACLQSLGRMGHHVSVYDADRQALTLRSRHCAGHVVAPGTAQSVGYAADLMDQAASGKYDWLLPISDDAVRCCSRYRATLESRLRIVLPAEATLATAASKRLTYEFAAAQGFPIPRTSFPVGVAELYAFALDVGYPCVVKLPYGSGRDGVFVVENAAGLARLCERHVFRGQRPMVQQFVPGALYAVTGVAQDGRIASLFMCRKPLEYTVGHVTAAAYSVIDAALEARARQIVEALQWTGPFGIDFMRGTDGVFLLLEINPRFSGPVHFAYRLGVDLPRDCFRLAFGEPLKAGNGLRYREGILYRSIFPCEALWCRANRHRPAALLKHVVRFGAVTNLYWDDPGLTWGQITQTRRALVAAQEIPT